MPGLDRLAADRRVQLERIVIYERLVLAVVLTITLLAGSPAVEAQQAGKVFRVGFLAGYSASADTPLFDSFRQGMRQLGYEEGRNVAY
jgi:hypothetical protein